MRKCKNCNEEFIEKYKKQKFCSLSCSSSFNNRKRKLTNETKKKIGKSVSSKIKEKWKNKTYRESIITSLKKRRGFKHSEETKRKIGQSLKLNKSVTSIYNVSSRTRSKIFKRMKLKCSNCGFGEIVCDLHHIYGRKIHDAHNHKYLSYLCPNCHRLADLGIIAKKDLINLDEQIGNEWKNFYYSINNGE